MNMLIGFYLSVLGILLVGLGFTEIDSHKYARLVEMAKERPVLKELVEKAYENELINQFEYADIVSKYNSLIGDDAKEKELKKLNKLIEETHEDCKEPE